MNRLFLILLLCLIIRHSAKAQSSLTLGFDGTGFISSGLQIRHAYTKNKMQFGAYATPAVVSPSKDPGLFLRGGIFVNRLNHIDNNVTLYRGISAEYGMGFFYTFYTDIYYLIGPQWGINIRASDKISFNSEWGARVGIDKTQEQHSTQGGAGPTYFVPATQFFMYFPVSVGLSLNLSRNAIKRP